MWRDDAYLLDILQAIRKIEEFTKGVSWERFAAGEVLQHAVMRMVQIIGEAARNVSPEFKERHPQIPWREIVGMRHRLVHQYFRVIPERVWEVVQNDIEPLCRQIEPLVPPDEP